MSTHGEIQFVYLDDIAKKSRLVASKPSGASIFYDSGPWAGFSVSRFHRGVLTTDDYDLLSRIRARDADLGMVY